MVWNVNIHCNYHGATSHHMLRRDIEALIQRGFFKKCLAKRKTSNNPLRMEALPSPPPFPSRDTPHSKRWSINVISGGFASRRKTSGAREVYAMNMPMGVVLGTRPQLAESDFISLSDEDLGHISSPHEDTLIITTNIEGYDVKRILVDSESSRNVLFFIGIHGYGEVEDTLEENRFPLGESVVLGNGFKA